MPFVPPQKVIPVLNNGEFAQTPFGQNQQALESNGALDNLAAGGAGTLAAWIAGANALLGQEDGAMQNSLAEFAASRSAAQNDLLGQVIQQVPNLAANVAAFGAGRALAGAAGLGAGSVNAAGAAATLPVSYPQHFGEAIGKGSNYETAGLAALANSAMDVLTPAAMLSRGAAKIAAPGIEAGTEYLQNLNTDAAAFGYDTAWNDPAMSSARRDAALVGGLSAAALTPFTAGAGREPEQGTVDVVDAKTGEVLGSSTGPTAPHTASDVPALIRNQGGYPASEPQTDSLPTMDQLDIPTVMRNSGTMPQEFDLGSIVGNRQFTYGKAVENNLAKYFGITPEEAANTLSAVAPEETNLSVWSTPAVERAAKVLEQQFFDGMATTSPDTLSTQGVTQADAVQGLLGQLQQTADIKSAFDVPRARDEALVEPRINSLDAMEQANAARIASQFTDPERPEPQNVVAPTRDQRVAAQSGQVFDMLGGGFTTPRAEPVDLAPERPALDRKTIDMFDVEGNLLPGADATQADLAVVADKFPALVDKVQQDAIREEDMALFNAEQQRLQKQISDVTAKMDGVAAKVLPSGSLVPTKLEELGAVQLPVGTRKETIADTIAALEARRDSYKKADAKERAQVAIDNLKAAVADVTASRKQVLESSPMYRLYANELQRLEIEQRGKAPEKTDPDTAAINTLLIADDQAAARLPQENAKAIADAEAVRIPRVRYERSVRNASKLESSGFSAATRSLFGDTGKGLRPPSLRDMKGVVSKIQSSFRDFPSVRILSMFSEAPPHVIERAAQEGHDGSDVHGFFSTTDGVIYVVQDKVESLTHLEQILLHEGFHMGLRQSGAAQEVVSALDNAIAKLGGLDGIVALAEQQGVMDRLQPYLDGWNELVAKGEATQERANRILLEETLAPLAERGGVGIGKWRKAVSAVADFVRSLGFERIANWLDSSSDPTVVAHNLLKMANRGLDSKSVDSMVEDAGFMAVSGELPSLSVGKEVPKSAPIRKKLSAIMDAVNGFLSRSGFGLAAYSFLAANTAVIRVVSPEIADRVSAALKDAKDKQRSAVSHIMMAMSESMDRHKLSDADRTKAMEAITGEIDDARLVQMYGKDSKIVDVARETRTALRQVYDELVQPIFLGRAQADLEKAYQTQGDSDAVGKAAAKAVRDHLQLLSEPADIENAVRKGKNFFVINADNKIVKVDGVPTTGQVFTLKHDRGHNHFPRVFDYDAIMRDKQGFIKQLMSATKEDGTPFVEDEKAAESIFNDLTANPDYYYQLDAVHSAEPIGAPVSGREKARKYNLPNFVFGKYIKQDVATIVPVYMSQLMNSAAFLREFGPMDMDADGNMDLRDDSNEIARMLNGIPDASIRQKVKRAVDASFNPNYQGARWSTEMRVAASAAQFAAAIAFMPLIVLSSLPEFANHIAAGRTALERDIAKKVMWKTITNMFSEKGRASNAMMRYRMESLGIISSELVDHAMHGISQAQEIMGVEGWLKSKTGDFYRRTGITRYTSFQEMLAGTIALESLRTASKALLSNETNVYDKQQAVSTLVRFTGVQPDAFTKMPQADKVAAAKKLAQQVSVWEQGGEQSIFDGDTAEQKEANRAVNLAINEGVRVRVAHANAGDVPFYFNDPLGKVVGQFKRFFYGATANILPNLTANLQDGEYGEGAKQMLWFAGIGIPAAAIGLMAAHAVKYAAATEIGNAFTGANNPQTPFSVWQHDKDFATNLLTESTIYATTGMLAATPYYGIMERPGGLLEPLNWAASAGLANTMWNKPESLVDNAALAAMMWYGGEKMSAQLDKRYKERIDSQRKL